MSVGWILCSFSTDLFENPLADEPHYRLRVIYAMPSVIIFDRHGTLSFLIDT